MVLLQFVNIYTKDNSMQKVNITQPIESVVPGTPLYITVKCKLGGEIMEGVVAGGSERTEYYVRFSALPEELREKVKTFIESSLRP